MGHAKERLPRAGVSEVNTGGDPAKPTHTEKKVQKWKGEWPQPKPESPKEQRAKSKDCQLLAYERRSYPKLENGIMEAHPLRRAWQMLVKEWQVPGHRLLCSGDAPPAWVEKDTSRAITSQGEEKHLL